MILSLSMNGKRSRGILAGGDLRQQIQPVPLTFGLTEKAK